MIDVLKDVGGDDILRKLIGITCDGAATMVGCHRGFASRIMSTCNELGGDGFVVNWCGSHQLNLAVGRYLDKMDELMSFRSKLGAEITFTRKFDSVGRDVGQCPTNSTTRWDSIHDTSRFIAERYSVSPPNVA